jgi:hypothetical protein
MARAAFPIITTRDQDVFRALARGPLTVRQILKLSTIFSVPFPGVRRLQRRLHALSEAGLLRQWWYATEGPGGEAYYTVAPEALRLVYGDKGMQPSVGVCGRVGVARQAHQRSLADFLVHTMTAVHRSGFTIEEFYRENTLCLNADGRSLYPDAAFTVLAPERPPLRFFVELDNGTEPITSPRERDSWHRKLNFYEALQDNCDDRFRVLGVVTKTKERLDHIVAAAADMSRDLRRPLFYGICLDDYLAEDEPLEQPCFRDHQDRVVALVPPVRRQPARPQQKSMVQAAAV